MTFENTAAHSELTRSYVDAMRKKGGGTLDIVVDLSVMLSGWGEDDDESVEFAAVLRFVAANICGPRVEDRVQAELTRLQEQARIRRAGK